MQHQPSYVQWIDDGWPVFYTKVSNKVYMEQ